VNEIRQFHRRYTPEFLIRHRKTHECFLIEIKPRSMEFHPYLSSRKLEAENFISVEKLDWKYKIVFDDEIILTSDQLEEFEQCFKLNSISAWKNWFEDYSQRLSRVKHLIQTHAPDNKKIKFLMFGTSDIQHPSRWSQEKS
jgi:hypothetical protein